MNIAESESRPVLGPAGNKARSVELRKPVSKLKNNKVEKPQEIKVKKSPALPLTYNSPSTPQPNCNTVPSILRKQQEHKVLKSNLSMNVSCSSDASSDSSHSRASTGRISRQSMPIRRKQSAPKPEKVVGTDTGTVEVTGSADASFVKKRCAWVTPNTDPCYAAFHDEEWGVPVHDDKKLFELLSLSTALAELTWPAILNKRHMFREVFQDFDPVSISKLNEKKITTPGSSASSLLSELKLRGVIENARQMCKNAYSVHLPLDVKVLPGFNQGFSLSMNNPFFKAQFAGAGQNFTAAPTKAHFLGGIPITAPHSILSSIGSVAGTTEPWFNLKTSRAPAQLTIFYGGTVNVFDDISPEKAQAIMLLAGNEFSTGSNVGQPRHQVQAPSSKPVAEDVVFVNQPKNTPPCSGLSSPTSVSSHPVGQSGGESINNDGPAKTSGGSTTHVNKTEAPKIVTSHGHVAASTMIQLAVPQARNASLARFLAKRKERVMSSAPYNNLTKKSAECSTPGSNGICLSGTSGLGSASVSTGKD